ncbi:MAG: winged helix-turn-helix domain-containing protein, partial [Campylobacterales bacterium]|nr:winged helix-turn-helix domain-containing protein [Campylobacterales bacterium]
LKPFDGDELLKALKKIYQSSKDDSLLLVKDNCFYDKGNKCVVMTDKTENLTEKESKLLELLLKSKGNLVSYEEIETTIWYDTYMTQETLRALVKNLRKKLPKDSVETVTGHGFKIKKRS